ncbi:MarR family winged helix-turn-helix transcriptional regulator [Sporolactobacillus spathodeae]|uniref:DNA-binding MarR family transcriptional regulator n=1 Tax=Sporolactobacillus spathodeae TaxID=1465502 RepID=A0ABS2QBW4_9BACL|nr:MarR family transcriptional regulator [Sporolactobacillus spathodeae]MBM7659131.1 DNA-binding MarR family transcriptional regulator [Sporolactobacillus spathodeae]
MFYRLHLVSKEMNRAFETMAHTSLTKLEILFHIDLFGEMSQLELIRRLKLDASAVTRHLKRMEAEAFIQRKKESKDRRFMLLSLTDKGQRELKRLIAIKESLQDDILSVLTNEQIVSVSKFIEHISEQINDRGFK